MAPHGKYFWLRSHHNSLCLDIDNGNPRAECDVITWEYREAPHQQWFYDQANHRIRTKADENLVLEERHDGRVILNNFHEGKDEQEWMVDGERVCRKNNRDRVLHIVDARETHAGHLCVEDWSDRPEHKWESVHLDADYFVIVSMHSGKGVDIEAADCDSGANVIMWDHHGNVNQQWYEDKYGFIRSRLNDFTFNTSDGHLEMDDVEVGSSGASWVRNGEAIVNKYDPLQCLEIEDASQENGAKIIQGRYYENPYQRWAFNVVPAE